MNGEPALSVALTGFAVVLAFAARALFALAPVIIGAEAGAFAAAALGAAELDGVSTGGVTLGGATFEGASFGAGSGASRGARAWCSYANATPAKARQAATGVITRQRTNANGPERGIVGDP